MLTIEKLQELGVNTQEGLNRCLNNEQFYFRLIQQVMSDDSVEKLKAALEANDLDTAFSIAHNLKGSLGNLSLTPIYEPIAKMTELLRTRTEMDYTPLINTVMEQKAAIAALCD